jgi:hypothetical protein
LEVKDSFYGFFLHGFLFFDYFKINKLLLLISEVIFGCGDNFGIVVLYYWRFGVGEIATLDEVIACRWLLFSCHLCNCSLVSWTLVF